MSSETGEEINGVGSDKDVSEEKIVVFAKAGTQWWPARKFSTLAKKGEMVIFFGSFDYSVCSANNIEEFDEDAVKAKRKFRPPRSARYLAAMQQAREFLNGEKSFEELADEDLKSGDMQTVECSDCKQWYLLRIVNLIALDLENLQGTFHCPGCTEKGRPEMHEESAVVVLTRQSLFERAKKYDKEAREREKEEAKRKREQEREEKKMLKNKEKEEAKAKAKEDAAKLKDQAAKEKKRAAVEHAEQEARDEKRDRKRRILQQLGLAPLQQKKEAVMEV
mmetsp:Transcript_15475/g.39183  ORF Transcript_15475/g.39183 Transcript_15475/m.39183 type:complete len:278 (-) Transcript_15475:1092-1925(-)